MSYKALYRTYRPKQFEDIVGQEHIVKTLENIILSDKISHAYLFSGPRGTGKTSTAHVFAKNLNCIDRQTKIVLCNKCEACNSDLNMDIIEIDAASNNGVSEIRSLIENSKYAPNSSKYKIYIIDEVHMLSKGAFNALLKTLEEPPEHVVFILATTEPHKIPVTILSRIQRFNFKMIDDKIIALKLATILEKESISFDQKSLNLIAKLASGSMRDAISIADQASAYSGGEIDFKSLLKIFGLASNLDLMPLIDDIAKGEAKNVLKKANQFLNEGKDPSKIIESIINILKDFIFYKKTFDPNLLDELSVDEVEKISISIELAYQMLDILVKISSDLRITEIPLQIYELGFLKLINLSNKDKNHSQINEKVVNKNFDKKTHSNNSEIKIPAAIEEAYQKSQLELEEKAIHEKIGRTMELMLNPSSLDEIEKDSNEEILQNEILSGKNNDYTYESISTKTTSNNESNSGFVFPFSIDEIINLLVQADKNIHEKNKALFKNLEQKVSPETRDFATLLQEVSLISSSNDFLLFVSKNETTVREINRNRKEDHFIRFIYNVFKKTALVFAISKSQFDAMKIKWAQLSNENRLPKAIPIDKVVLKKANKTNAEELGESLFGDIFSK